MHVRLPRRSDLRPQRMMGVVGQKWRTSGYHCRSVSGVHASSHRLCLPCRGRSQESSGSRWRSRRRADPSLGMKAVSVDRTPPVQQCPIAPTLRPCRTACARRV